LYTSEARKRLAAGIAFAVAAFASAAPLFALLAALANASATFFSGSDDDSLAAWVFAIEKSLSAEVVAISVQQG
jgi:hypothetical protein